jgi:predicted DNA-binding transcriptional regulator AlpA
MAQSVILFPIPLDEVSLLIEQSVDRAFQKRQANSAPTKRKPLRGAKEIAEHCGLAESTVYKLTASNELPHSKRGKILTADPDKLDAWLLANEIKPTQQTATASNIYTRRRTRKTAAA